MYLSGYDAWQLVFLSVGATLILNALANLLFRDDVDPLSVRIKRYFFRVMRWLPSVQTKIDKEVDKTLAGMEKSVHKHSTGKSRQSLPAKGLSVDSVIDEIKKLEQMATVDWKSGVVSGAMYNCSDDLTRLTTQVYGMCAWTNPLHSDLFPHVRKMEAEVVQWTLDLFNGGPQSCGTMTTGGTESILMAMRAYRQIGYEKGIEYPEIVLSVSAHCAFDKAAEYFRMKLTHVPVDPVTRMIDLAAMKRAISSSTVVLVASAPHFPHGIVDPIQQVAKLGLRYKIGVHVDSCLGGFVVPFMEEAGFEMEPFDFRVDGVTSISADTHKYGFAPKGTSVIMYSSKSIRRMQYFVASDWTGGVYATPTICGSRAGSLIAATWATLMHMGRNGYVESTKKIVTTTRKIAAELSKVPGVYVVGSPKVNVVGVASNEFDIFRVYEKLIERGWNLNGLQFPSSFHLCVTMLHTKEGVADKFVRDVSEVVAQVASDPKTACSGAGAIYGTAQSIPDRSIVNELAKGFIDILYKC